MLSRLVVRNVVLIEAAELEFGPGLNVISGETGAGKSLVVGALELLLGRRPRAGLLRRGAREASVEGHFVLAGEGRREASRRVSAWLARQLPAVLDEWGELDGDEERELVIRRELVKTEKGELRTRSRINGRAVKTKDLRGLAGLLLEVHGQNDHQLLLDPAEQLRLVDSFGKLGKQVAGYLRARSAWLELGKRAERIAEREASSRGRAAEIEDALAELLELEPVTGERAQLAERREMLRHGELLRNELGGVVYELSEQEGAVVDRLRAVQRTVERWRGRLAALAGPTEELEAAALHGAEAARGLQSFLEEVDVDPAELERIEERMKTLDDLARKHAVEVDELSQLVLDLEDERETLERDVRDAGELDEAIAKARAELESAARKLTRSREVLRPRCFEAVGSALVELGLEGAAFGWRHEPQAPEPPSESEAGERLHWQETWELDRQRFGERGADRIEFLWSANAGELPGPLRQVASGGEVARVMLALRGALTGADRGRTLLFDEIDTGVGGRLGPQLGAHLQKLGRHHQILCVTHLPAIAAAGAQHLCVKKGKAGNRVTTEIRSLTGDERVAEVADMIAGGADSDTARAEARRLLGAR